MTSFSLQHKTVRVWPGTAQACPIIYFHAFEEISEQLLQQLSAAHCPQATLVIISDLDWNRDMVPWNIPQSDAFHGGADAYLRLLISRIIPEAEKTLSTRPLWRGIAGYSLAGLFAIYALYQSDAFSRAASISGSLWFPGIKEYCLSHEPRRTPDHLYFSLGNKEHKTRNQLIRCVRENTEAIVDHARKQGIDTTFQLNPGSHYTDVIKRCVDGIQWLLER